ncbi:hypothetical protein BpHYR1_037911 [Brachionus plicatilis]|uniref:Uncharacterized protein n=1 Tax=Brachionus plicatilis TaxID=10195 RepID=A0A3M7SPR0_BRAPC|nr:hypothetical protein BpHYR1_037911 [Brachionus plicatilis]
MVEIFTQKSARKNCGLISFFKYVKIKNDCIISVNINQLEWFPEVLGFNQYASFNTYRYYFFPDIYMLSFINWSELYLIHDIWNYTKDLLMDQSTKNGYFIRYWIWFRQVLFFVSTIVLDPYFFDQYPKVSYHSAMQRFFLNFLKPNPLKWVLDFLQILQNLGFKLKIIE